MPKITKTEEQLTKELEVAMRKLYRTLPGTTEEKIQTLRAKFESEMQQLIQPSQTEMKSKKREPTEEMKSILDLLRKLESCTQIAKQYGRTPSAITQTAKRNGIYSLNAVRRELRQELRQESSKGLSNEELATKMGVYPEAIERVRKELEQGEKKSKRKKEPTEEMKSILDLLRKLEPHAQIAEQYGKDHSYISVIAKQNGIYSPKAVRHELRQESSRELSSEDLAAKMGVYLEAIERVRKELEQGAKKNKRKKEPSEEMKSILDLLRKLELHAQIAEQYGKHHSYISAIAKRNGIYSPKAVRQELRQESSKELSNEELATKMGVYPEAIERVRKELEQGEIKGRSKKAKEHAERTEREVKKELTEEKADSERKAAVEITQPNIEKVVEPPQAREKITQHSQEGQTNRKNRVPVKRVDTKEFFEMAKQAVDVKTMAERLGVTKGRVGLYLTMYGFWERAQVVEVLNKMNDSEIAKRSKLSIEAIKRIREQEQTKTEKRSSKFAQDNRLAIQRRQASLEKDEEKKFFAKSNSYKSIQQWEGKTGVSSYKIVIGLRRLRSIGAASAHQLKLLQDWEEENIVKVSQPRRQANLKIEWIKYQGAVRNMSLQSTKTAKRMMLFNIERLLALYEDLLTNGQYAYLCYGYIKMEEELKALELGKEKLGLREPTLLALREKIKEVQESEMQKRKPEGPTSGAGDAR